MAMKSLPWKNLFGWWGTSRNKSSRRTVEGAHRGLRLEALERREMLSISLQPGIVGTVATGQQFRQNISFLDDSAATQWDVDVDYGDGSTAQYDCTSKSFLLNHSYATAGAYQASVVITNNNDPIDTFETALPLTVLPTVSIDDVVVNEGSQAVFTITLSSAGTQRVSMVVTSANGTAISGSNYDATNSLVSIAAGQTTATFVVSTTDDSTAEGDETFSVLISSLTNAAAGNLAGTGTIAEASVVGRHIFYNNSSFDGNNSGINANDDAAIATDKEAFLPTAGQTATSANYTTYSNGINGIIIDVAHLANPAALTADDFSFLVGNTANPSEWTTAAPTPLTIRVRMGEGFNGSDRIEITCADGAIKNEWLQVKVLATANTGLDSPDLFYFGNLVGDTGTGNTSTQAVVDQTDTTAITANPASSASITNVADINRDGSVNSQDLSLATANAGATLAMLQGPTLSITNVLATEGANLVFTLTLSMPSPLPITVEYHTVNGSAIAGSDKDYLGVSGTVTFEVNETTKTVTIATRADGIDEYDENLTLVLSNPTNVTLASTSAVGTIFDVDAAPTVNISSVTAYEGHQALFEVTLSSASEKSISVGYTTTSDSATAGSDYRSTSGTLVFAPGQTSKIVAVTTLRDAEQEPLETFSVTLSNPVNATLGTATAAGTILDNTLKANGDSYELDPGTVLTVIAPGVLTNDSELSGDPLQAILVAGPSYGTLTLNSDGSFTYDPEGYTGEFSFTYKAWDGQVYSSEATVTLTVKSTNAAPTATFLVNPLALAGTTITAMLANPQDLSNADRQAGFHYSFALDSSQLATNYAEASGSSSFSTLTWTPGDYTIYGRIFDQHDGYTDYSASVTVVPYETLLLGNDGPIFEGCSTVVYFANYPSDTYSFRFGFSTDPANLPSSFEQAGLTPYAIFSFANDGSYTAYGRIWCRDEVWGTDSSLNPDTGEYESVSYLISRTDSYTDYTTTVVVADAAPTATLTNNGPARLGNPVTVSFANSTDPSPADTAAGFHYSFALDPDQLATSYASATDGSTKDFTFTAAGTYTVYGRIFDQDGAWSDYSTTVTISANTPPTAVNDSYAVNANTSSTIQAPGVLNNDDDPEDDSLTAVLVTGPSHGTLSLNSDGSFTYTPTSGYVGTDSFTYTANDGLATSAPATVTLTVKSTNAAPTATFLVNPLALAGTTITAMLANPQDLSNADRQAGFHYSFALDSSQLATNYAEASGSSSFSTLTWTPGDYTIYGRIFDQHDGYTDYSASVTVVPYETLLLGNDGPIFEGCSTVVYFANYPSDTYSFRFGFSTDPANLPSSFEQAGLTPYAIFSFANDGSYTAYGRIWCRDEVWGTDSSLNPDTGEYESVSYLISRTDSYTDYTTTVVVADAAPTATLTNNGPARLGNPVTVSFANSTDPSPADTAAGFHYSFALDPDQLATSYASATDGSTKDFTFTAAGTYTVYGRIFDQDGAWSDYSTTVTISANTPPTAVNDSYAVNANTSSTIQAPGVLNNDDDPEDDSLTAVLVTGPSHGTLSLNSDGSFTYTPTSGYVGTDSFTYTATDGLATSAPATVTLMVANHAPTVATAASATPNSVVGTTTMLSARGADVDTGEGSLTYTWATTGTLPAPVDFGANNGTNAARDLTATFHKAGSYTFQVTISDGYLSTTSTVTVVVDQTFRNIAVSPSSVTVSTGATQQFTATALDQFGNALAEQPTFTWSTTVGTISQAGLLTTPQSDSIGTVTASNVAISGIATVTASNAAPTATFLVSQSTILAGVATRALFSNPQDSSNADLAAGFRYSFALDPSQLVSTYADASSDQASPDFAFYNNGTYLIYGRIFDQHDAYTEYSASVTVAESSAIILINDGAINEGASTTLSFLNAPTGWTDSGIDENGTPYSYSYSYRYSFSTDQGSLAQSYDAAGNDTGGSLTFTDSGSQTAWGRIWCSCDHPYYYYIDNGDGTGGLWVPVSGSYDVSYTDYSTAVAVLNVAPTATLTNNGPVNVGSMVTPTFTNPIDPSPVDTAARFHYSIALDPDQLATSYASATDGSTKGFTLTTAGTYTVYGRIFDQDGAWSDYSTTVTVSANTPPTAVNDSYAVNANTSSTIQAPGVLNNDDDPEDDSLTAVLVAGPSHGTLILNSDGSFTYTPTSGYVGTDSFTYTAIDSLATSAPATVTLMVANHAPTVATPASATPNSVVGTTTTLSARGADVDTGEGSLRYTWATMGTLPAPVDFSANNGTHAARDLTTTLHNAGSYTFQVTISDGYLSTTSSVTVVVDQTLTSITVSPSLVTVRTGATRQFAATGLDQFGNAMLTQPAFAWSTEVGTITEAGLLTAPQSSAIGTVTATFEGVSGISNVTVTNDAPTVATAATAKLNPVTGKTAALSVLGADEDTGEGSLSYTWETEGEPPASVDFSGANNGTNAAKNMTATFTTAGTYQFKVTIADPGGQWITDFVEVTVDQTLRGLTLSPSSVTVNAGATRQFTAMALDQFEHEIAGLPIAWSTTAGTISGDHVLMASLSLSSGIVTVTCGTMIATSNVTITHYDTSLSNNSVAENQPIGTTVGTFATSGPGVNHDFTYTLVDGEGSDGNEFFSVVNGILTTSKDLDYDSQPSCTIRVRTTAMDQNEISFERIFSIRITDLDESLDATIGGDPTWCEGHVAGTLSALHFDGDDDYLSLGNCDSSHDVTDLTFAAWVRREQFGGTEWRDRLVVAEGRWGWGVGFNCDDQIMFTLVDVNSVWSQSAIIDGNWHFVAVTFSRAAEMASFYIDGALDSQASAERWVNALAGVPENWEFDTEGAGYSIGSRYTNEHFKGAIDTVNVWTRVLGGDEIAALYNARGPFLTPTSTLAEGMLLFYHFEEPVGSGGTIHNLAPVVHPTASTSLTTIDAEGAYGGTTTLVATLTANGQGMANETVTFTLNGTKVGTATTNENGVATLGGVSIAGPNVGSYSAYVGATFAGDSAYSPSSATANLTVNKALLQVTADAKSRSYGTANPPLTASITGFVNGEILSTSGVTGSPVLSTTVGINSPVGEYPIEVQVGTLTASNYDFSLVNGKLTVVAVETVTTFESCSPNPSAYGQEVTFTFTVSPASFDVSGVPTGKVQFLEGTTVLGEGTLDSSGIVTFGTRGLGIGHHTITAIYGGDVNFTSSTGTTGGSGSGGGSGGVDIIVTAAATTCSVTSSANPSSCGDFVTFTAVVSPAPPSSGTPTGAVTFKDGETLLATVELSGGVATFTTSSLVFGHHNITVVYGGDGGFSASTSQPLDQNVENEIATTTTVTSSVASPYYGQPVTFTATVRGAKPGTPTGTITFKDGGVTLATVTMSNGAATFTTSTLSVGRHSITAVYSGDGIFTSSIGRLASPTRFSGSGGTGGTGDGELLVAPNSLIITVAGNGSVGYGGDNQEATAATLNSPQGVVVDSAGNIFIADTDNNCVRMVDTEGTITTIAGKGTRGFSGDNDFAINAELNGPTGLALDSAGNLFIVDFGNNRIREVRAVNGHITANSTIITVAGGGTNGLGDGGLATEAELYWPTDVAVDSLGNLYIADFGNNRIRKVSANQGVITSTSVITTVVGNGIRGFSGDNDFAINAELNGPTGLAVDSVGNMYIADSYNSRVRKVIAVNHEITSASTIVTIAGTGTAGFSGDGYSATSARLDLPWDVAVDSDGNLFIADRANGRIRVVVAGKIVTVVGGGNNGLGDGGQATAAQLSDPQGLAVDSNGTLFLADASSNRVREVCFDAYTVKMADTTTTVTPSPTTYSNSITFTVTVAAVAPAGGSPTGQVIFKQNGVALAGDSTVTLSGGTATFTTSALSVGTNIITAEYVGDGNYKPSAGSTAIREATQTTLATDMTSLAYGDEVTFTVQVTPVDVGAAAPTQGWVYFYLDGAVYPNWTGSCSLNGNGQATWKTTRLIAGQHTVSAVFVGDASFASSTSNSVVETVAKKSLKITPIASREYGDLLPPILDESSYDGFVNGDTSACLSTQPTISTDAQDNSPVGVYSLTAQSADASNYTITYLDGGRLTITPATLQIQVISQTKAFGAADPALTYTASGFRCGDTVSTILSGSLTHDGHGSVESEKAGRYDITQGSLAANNSNYVIAFSGGQLKITANTTISLSLSPRSTNSSTYGQTVEFIATVASNPSAAGMPNEGYVILFVGGVQYGNSVYVINGTATLTEDSISAGTHSITAAYFDHGGCFGDSSRSAAISLTVNTADTSTTVTASPNDPQNIPVSGQLVRLTATITVANEGHGRPSGPVTFRAGNQELGTSWISYWSNGIGYAYLDTTALTAGTHSITATYESESEIDSNCNGSSGTTTVQVNSACTTTTIATSATSPAVGQTVTLTATIRAVNPGSGVPTGTVTFMDGNTVLGTATVNASGEASLSTSALSLGSHTITATYQGDASFQLSSGTFGPSLYITTAVGSGVDGFSGDGSQATNAQMNTPADVIIDAFGNLLIADTGNHCIRKVSVDGTITTIAGNGTAGFSGDGDLATAARLNGPTALAMDSQGNLYIADFGNNRVRKVIAINGQITASSTIITVAGGGTGGLGDDGVATAAQLDWPIDLAIDSFGNLFISDYYNNRVRKVIAIDGQITSNSTIVTVAGNGLRGFSGDNGAAGAAELDGPTGMAFESDGSLLIVDSYNGRIRKVTAAGGEITAASTITTFAGTGNFGFGGDGGYATVATFNLPWQVTVDSAGNVFIVDRANDRIRKVATDGIITTVAGDGVAGFSGDGYLASTAALNDPQGLAVDSNGNLFIADAGNYRVRKVSSASLMVISTPNQLYWDADGDATSAIGGSGTWDKTSLNWRSGGPTGSLQAWAEGSEAIFPTSSGTITVAASMMVDALIFQGDGCVLKNNSLIFVASEAVVDVANGKATISSTITGTGDLDKTGAGSLLLTGTDSMATATVASGTLLVSGTLSLSGSLTNQATVIVVGEGVVDEAGTLLHGSGDGVSSSVMALWWSGLSGDSQTTYTCEASIDGSTYFQVGTISVGDWQLVVSGLQPQTTYALRVVATHTDGSREIYDSGRVTLGSSQSSRWYRVSSISLAGSTADGQLQPGDELSPDSASTAYIHTIDPPSQLANAAIYTYGASGTLSPGSFVEDTSWVYAESAALAVLQSLTGLVTDGSLPTVDDSGSVLLWHIERVADGGSIVADCGYTFDQHRSLPTAAAGTHWVLVPYTMNVEQLDPVSSEGSVFWSSGGTVSAATGAAVVGADAIDSTDGTAGLTYDSRETSLRSSFGQGWTDSDEYATLSGGSQNLAVRLGAENTLWFDKQLDGSYLARDHAKETLVHTTGYFVFTQTDGTQYFFYDSKGASHRQYSLYRRISPNGSTLDIDWNTDGTMHAAIYKTSPMADAYQKRVFTYWGDVYCNHVQTVTLQAWNPDPTVNDWGDVRRITYNYYNGSESYGFKGDLKTVVTDNWNGSAWVGGDTYYYRYYTAEGNKHLIERILSPADYATLYNVTGGHPENASETQTSGSVYIGDYTSTYYTYDTSGRVSKIVVAHGSNESSISTRESGNANGYNIWKRKSVETWLDGTEKTTYTNFVGKAILTDLLDPVSHSHTIIFNHYDEDGNLVLTASPSAFTGVDYLDAMPDLVGYTYGDSPFLNNADGLFEVTTYYETSADGGAKDYVHKVAVARGETAARAFLSSSSGGTLLASYTYEAHTVVPTSTNLPYTIYTIASCTTYSNTDGTGAATTKYAYNWDSGSFQPRQVTTTAPVVATAQNGAGGETGATAKQWFDDSGCLRWTMNELGRVTYYEYEALTNRLIKTIEDISANTAVPISPPSGWSLPSSGVNATTEYQYDALGRITQMLGPAHMADINGIATPIQTASWVFYDVAPEVFYNTGSWTGLYVAHETRAAQGYKKVGTDEAVIVGPVTITQTDADGRVFNVVQAAYSGTVDHLATALISRGDITAWTAYGYQDSHLVRTAVYTTIPATSSDLDADSFTGTAGVNYLVTSYGYEDYGLGMMGRQNKTVAADGTITRVVYDARGSILETWIGTYDTGATDSDPSGDGAYGNNMVIVSSSTYDADGNLTSARSYFGDGGNDCYTTTYKYDWRDRLTDVLSPANIVTHTEYDNLGHITWAKTYASDSFETSDDELRAQSQNFFDSLGRIYETRTFNVDPENFLNPDYVKVYLPTNYWYDEAGNVIKTATGKTVDSEGDTVIITGYGATRKYVYDGLGRLTDSYTCYDTDEVLYADARNVDGDTVVEQTHTWYNAASEAVATATYQRLPDDPATNLGALDATNSYATASVTWYDGLGRTVATADYGREDSNSNVSHRYFFDSTGNLIKTDTSGLPGAAVADPHKPYTTQNPDSMAGIDFQLQFIEYDAAGRAYRTIDNIGRINQTDYDAAGRVVRTIQNYEDGVVVETDTETDVTVEYEYDTSGRLVTMTTENAQGNGNGVQEQKTKYLYTSEINASWQTAVVYPDSDDNDTITQDLTTNVWTLNYGNDHVSTDYDRLGRVTKTVDQRGVEHDYTFDSAGRAAADKVASLDSDQNVDGSVLCIGTTYDDMGRVRYVTSYNINYCDQTGSVDREAAVDSGTIVNEVKYVYDGWGNVSREFQEHGHEVLDSIVHSGCSAYVAYSYDDGTAADGYYDTEAGCELKIAQHLRLGIVRYPRLPTTNTARTVQYLYASGIDDIMSRVTGIETDAANASFAYLGADTVVSQDDADIDVELDYSTNNFAAWDRFGRVVDQLWSDYGTTWSVSSYSSYATNPDPDHFTCTYDRAGNVHERHNVLKATLDEIYAYDGLDRLIDSTRADGFHQTWDYDSAGNIVTASQQDRTVNAANEIIDASGMVTPTYDAAGNMTSGPKTADSSIRQHYIYDAWNRLVAVKADDGDGHPGDTVEEYAYDGLNRRCKKTDPADDIDSAGEYDDYYYNQDGQIVEDRYGTTTMAFKRIDHYVWSPVYVDTPIACLHDGRSHSTVGPNGNVDDEYEDSYLDPTLRIGASDWRTYYLTDANHNVTTTIRTETVASTNEGYSPIVHEGVSRNVYTAYGMVTRCNADWTVAEPGTEANFDGPLYSGYFLDVDTGLYQDRSRYYDPSQGRFINRDPIGYAAGTNLYAYCGDNPINRTDPSGQMWFLPPLIVGIKSALAYLATQAVISGAETGIEYAFTAWTGSAGDCSQFSWLETFGKNVVANTVTGGISSKGKWAYRAGAWAFRQGVEIGAETAYDVYRGRDFVTSLQTNIVGSLVGEGIGRTAIAGGKAAWRGTSRIATWLGEAAGGNFTHSSQVLDKVLQVAQSPKFRVRSANPSAIHGNSLSSPRTAYLYRLEDTEGNLLKWGVTQDMAKRYPKWYLEDKNMVEWARGSRADMIRVERGLVETQPGPLNFERWAGSRLGEQP